MIDPVGIEPPKAWYDRYFLKGNRRMVFSSMLFLFAFLSFNLIAYFFCKSDKQNMILLIFSLIFYSWSGIRYVGLLLLLVGISWASAMLVAEAQRAGKKGTLWMVIDIVLLLVVLGAYKYTGFFVSNARSLFGWKIEVPQIVLPLGISFYTFQLLSYNIDVYRKEAKAQPKYWKLLLYAGLFHQCVAGPIVRYQTIADEIDNRKSTITDRSEGIRRFAIGLAKKSILANGCAKVADSLLPSAVSAIGGTTVVGLWLGMAFYMMEIYLDFSAYSDMAIGMGRMVGFHYLENFDYPYSATSVRDFWRRWHISLSSFFRDYVYIPMGGSRVSTLKWIRNILVTWLLTGMWHGASWNFIFWGLSFALFLLMEKILRQFEWPKLIKHVYALLVVYFGWILFRFDDMNLLQTMFSAMFGGQGIAFSNFNTSLLFINNLFFMLFAMIACSPLGRNVKQIIVRSGNRRSIVYRLVAWFDILLPTVLLILSACALIGNSYNPFLYFRF